MNTPANPNAAIMTPAAAAAAAPSPYLENVVFDELTVGRSASLTRTLTSEDILLFARVSGDVNPAHLDEDYAKTNLFHGVIGHGMWLGGLISTVLGTIMPGPGTIYLGQDLKFKKPVRLNDKIMVTLSVKEKRNDKPIVIFECRCVNQSGETVLEGTSTVLAPTERVRRPRPEMPDVEIYPHDHYHGFIDGCRKLEAVTTAVVHPVEPHILTAVADAARERLMIPILIGPRARIVSAATEAGVDISCWKLIDAEHSHAAAAQAADLAAEGKADSIMKGSLHTAELLEVIAPTASRLHTGRKFSHAYVMDLPGYHKLLLVTDAVVNVEPDLPTKVDICQNAINLWRVMYGTDKKPNVAILSAVDITTPKLPTTLDAATLCKMAERGQITGAIVDGPLAIDNALSAQAAHDNGVESPVAGNTDILMFPNMESANIMARRLAFFGHSDAAGVLLGVRVPVLLPRPTDNLRTHLMSCALAMMLAKARREGKIK